MIQITHDIALSEDELRVQFIRASGPGGQNVNKVATAVQLRFDAAHSPSLPEDARIRLMALAGRRMNADGVLVIDARRFRKQTRNREDAVGRLVELIREASKTPKPRKKTRPGLKAKERRLQTKHRHTDTKRMRGPVSDLSE